MNRYQICQSIKTILAQKYGTCLSMILFGTAHIMQQSGTIQKFPVQCYTLFFHNIRQFHCFFCHCLAMKLYRFRCLRQFIQCFTDYSIRNIPLFPVTAYFLIFLCIVGIHCTSFVWNQQLFMNLADCFQCPFEPCLTWILQKFRQQISRNHRWMPLFFLIHRKQYIRLLLHPVF